MRIIPAYAGSTPALRRSGSAPRDHPRIRGEHLNERAARQRRKGSSPHTRGARWRTPVSPGVLGIIPAYAGSTAHVARPQARRADHPRIRGEHSPVDPSYSKHEGSSPHTRGAREHDVLFSARFGIIPAYAGSTSPPSLGVGSSSDHPRIRGEHRFRGDPLGVCSGSSPHTRGARYCQEKLPKQQRIIPAYAGSTCPCPSSK